jgi:tyrosine-protein phosphatase SIW14
MHSTGRKALGIAMVALLGAMACAARHAQQSVNTTVPAANPRYSDDAKHSIPPKSTLRGVSNFGEVSTTLYRGAQPTSEGFDNLAKMGVNIVVDLRGSREGERKAVTKRGMRYVAIPWRCFHPQDEFFARFLRLLRENPGKKVFVHCRLGDDRTGMMVAAYRMTRQGWTPEDARKEMEAYGVGWFHRVICYGLASYEKSFPQRFRTSPAFQDLRAAEPTPAPQP